MPERINTGDMRAFERAIVDYCNGRGSIDKLRAFVAALDPYVAAYGWGSYVRPAVRDDDGNVMVETTLNTYRNAAAIVAAGRQREAVPS